MTVKQKRRIILIAFAPFLVLVAMVLAGIDVLEPHTRRYLAIATVFGWFVVKVFGINLIDMPSDEARRSGDE